MRKISAVCAVLLLRLFVLGDSAVRAQEPGCADYTRVFPYLVNTQPISGGAYEVQVVGDRAYVAQKEGLSIWDVTDPRDPARLGSLATGLGAYRLCVAGDYVYATLGGGIGVIDASDAGAPTLVASLETPGLAQNLVVSGDLVCVAERYGTSYIDIGDPRAPQLLSYVPEDFSEILDVAVRGNTSFVAAYAALMAYDIADPAAPTLISRLLGVEQVISVEVAGDFAYLAVVSDESPMSSSCWALTVVDISAPEGMRIVGKAYTGVAIPPFAMSVRDGFVYLPIQGRGVMVVDVADPTRPEIVGYGNSGWVARDGAGIALKEGVALVGAGDSGLLCFDLDHSGYLDQRPLLGMTRRFAVQDGLAYVGAGSIHYWPPYSPTGLQILDVSNPGDIQELGSVTSDLGAGFVELSGTTAFVGYEGQSDIAVVDASDPANPVEVNRLATHDVATMAEVHAGYLVVAGYESGSVEIFDLADPADPQRVGFLEAPHWVAYLAVTDERIIVGGATEVSVVDWTVPSAPAVLGTTTLPVPVEKSIRAAGSYFYASSWAAPGLLVCDMSDPDAVEIVSSLEPDGGFDSMPSRCEMDGNVGYLAWGGAGLLAIDFSDPVDLRVLASVDIPDIQDVGLGDDAVCGLTWSWLTGLGTCFSLPLPCLASPTDAADGEAPRAVFLGQNFPNPFNPVTQISFDLPGTQRISLDIYDLKGRLVRTLIEDEVRTQGRYTVTWNGRDDAGRSVAGGAYCYRLNGPGLDESRKMILMK